MVYFMYKKDISDEIKWRKYNVTTDSWEALYSAPINVTNIDFAAGFRVDDVNMVIYFQWHEENPFQYYFAPAVLDLNNNLLHMGNADLSIENYRMYSTLTLDGKTNTVLYFEQLGGSNSYSDIGLWRSNSNEAYPTDQFYEYDSAQIDIIKHLNLSSSGNEIHVIWKDSYGNNFGNNLRYIYDDQAPLTPTNFTGSTYNNHPKLTWSLINGPDVVYEIHRKVSPFGEPAGTWQLLTTVSSATGSYVDNGFEITGQQREGTVEYKVRATDAHSSSAFTNSVSYFYYGVNKITSDYVKEFSLSQNYPNPFNPSTVISYSIPFEGSVRLRVFNMLGEIVSELVNKTQSQGKYDAFFDGSNLASGMYFYSLEAISNDGSQNLKEVKKMLLQK